MDYEEGAGRKADEQTRLNPASLAPRWRGGCVIIAAGMAAVLSLGFATHQFSASALAGDGDGTVAVPAAVVSPVPVADYSDADDAAWASFTRDFGKTYTDADAEALHRSYFHARVAELEARNALNGAPVFGVTAHADRAPGAAAFGRGRSGAGVSGAYAAAPEAVDLDAWRAAARGLPAWDDEAKVDWRAVDGVVTPVKNQGQCGSCWAFSATAQVESQFALVRGSASPVVLSAQQVTSCATPDIVDVPGGCCLGCGGGDTIVAYDYLRQVTGHAPASYWPYAQALVPDGLCLGPSCTLPCDTSLEPLETNYDYIGPFAKVAGYAFATPPCVEDCANQDLAALADAVRAMPVSVCVNAAHWDDYTGGVLAADACGSTDYDALDHCVQVVGYDATSDEPYWILRNSWSTAWGEDGFIRLAFGENTCGLANEATVAKLAK